MLVKWSETALSQANELTSFYPENKANEMIDSMVKDINNLTAFPMMGKIEPQSDIPNVRYILSGELRVIYSIHKDFISILNVYHAKYQYIHVNIDPTYIS